MQIVNQQLAAAKTYLRADIQSAITNAVFESNAIQQVRATIANAVSGTVSGTDNRLLQNCDTALQMLSRAISQLNGCLQYVEQIDVTEDNDG